MEEYIIRSIEHSMRSMFLMVAVVRDSTGQCFILDHNKELENISAGRKDEEGNAFAKRKFSDPRKGNLTGTDRFVPEHRIPAGSVHTLFKSLKKNIHPEDREAFTRFTDHDAYVKDLEDHVFVSVELRIRHADRKYYWSELILCNTTEEDSTEGNDCLFMIRDINDRKTLEIRREADEREILKSLQDRYDSLFEENMTDQQTGCYNRKGLKFYSDVVITDASENDRNIFVCVADLNGLKHLNDTYGHAAGDEAIAAVSSELRKAAPSGSKLVRIGGDEFMIFAAVDKDSTEPGQFSEKVERGISEYNESHSNPYSVGASYGWVLLPAKEGMTGLDEYIEMADAKMYDMRMERDKYRRD